MMGNINGRMQYPSRQRGLSIVGWVVVLMIAASLVTVLLRLGPHYVDFRTIQAVMADMPEGQIHTMDKGSIRDLLRKRFRINNIRSIAPRDVVAIERGKNLTQVNVGYEVREHIVGNIDVVLTFDESYSYR